MQEVQRWGRSWPIALVFWAVAERAWLHPEAAQFTFIPHLAKLAVEAFIVEQLMGEGLGVLEAFRDEGEWILVADFRRGGNSHTLYNCSLPGLS